MCELPDIDFSDPSAIPLISGPSAIPRTQSECSNPDTNEICSGFGTCEEMEDDADWCNCDYLDSDGNKVDMNSFVIGLLAEIQAQVTFQSAGPESYHWHLAVLRAAATHW